VEVSSTVGSAAPTLTAVYTNTAGVAGRTNTNLVATTTTSPTGTFYPISLQAGDTGVQLIQSLGLSVSWASGTISLVAYRILARLELTGANIPNAIDAITSGFPRLYDNSVPFLIFIPNTTTTSNITGSVVWTQG
jgi:hypothetical protein